MDNLVVSVGAITIAIASGSMTYQAERKGKPHNQSKTLSIFN
jgi:hypothetical protein